MDFSNHPIADNNFLRGSAMSLRRLRAFRQRETTYFCPRLNSASNRLSRFAPGPWSRNKSPPALPGRSWPKNMHSCSSCGHESSCLLLGSWYLGRQDCSPNDQLPTLVDSNHDKDQGSQEQYVNCSAQCVQVYRPAPQRSSNATAIITSMKISFQLCFSAFSRAFQTRPAGFPTAQATPSLLSLGVVPGRL